MQRAASPVLVSRFLSCLQVLRRTELSVDERKKRGSTTELFAVEKGQPAGGRALYESANLWLGQARSFGSHAHREAAGAEDFRCCQRNEAPSFFAAFIAYAPVPRIPDWCDIHYAAIAAAMSTLACSGVRYPMLA